MYTHQGEVWMWEILRRSQMAGNEAEKFKGIVRFSELAEGMLYAPIHPTHHVLPLIVRHFQKRFSCEEWAVHDVGRHVAAYYDGKQVTIVRVESLKTDIAYSQDEEGFQQLWRDYYRHMAIRERNNPTAQRSFLPKKYWAYLTEMGGKT
ncbi:TIGR03915 family putative DNA repair protein [Dialister invisus]|uniref:TIGR03915 family putative DNA repair protein n=1 Tax=Dialister invisus TaxID=218538 RepID=UPI003FD6C307